MDKWVLFFCELSSNFSYISPTFTDGSKRVLEAQDIMAIEDNHKSAFLVERLERYLNSSWTVLPHTSFIMNRVGI